MIRANKAKQLVFSLPSKIGLLTEVAALMAAAKVNIEAICAYEMEGRGIFMLLTDQQAKAKKALAQLEAEVKSEEIITVAVPNRIGELQKVARRISEAGIDISYLYGSPVKGKMTLVIKTKNDKKAIRQLNA